VKTNDEPLVPLRVEIATQSDRDEPDNRATPNNLPMKTEPPPSVKSRVKPRSAVAISAVAQAANRTNNERFDALAQPRPEETIVNVTIGKLEVRAVVPPPQAPREPARSAVMSLEDYLKDKRAGRR
jgi:hypothetical protein